jgi:D-tyrosyl-tRNA(Tyr) deacylase
MRAFIQRVSEASVSIGSEVTGSIRQGLVILLGIETEDTTDDIEWLCPKILNLRIFNDEAEIMNRSVLDIGGGILIISQFTLHASTKKGNRPSYIRAAKPSDAIPLYDQFILKTERILGKKVQTGRFGAMMQVQLINDGPVTIIIDSRNKE